MPRKPNGQRVVVSIDGGGIRGILPATLLAAVSQIFSDETLCRVADLLAGTSTGGLIMSGVYAGRTAAAMLDLYVKNGTAIFSRSPWQYARSGFGRLGPASKYRADALREALQGVLKNQWLSRPGSSAFLLVPSYAIQLPRPIDMDNDGVAESASALLFKSVDARADPSNDFSLVDVCRATSAAPTYFPAALIRNANGDEYRCVDGGTFANNPAMCAWAEADKRWPMDRMTVISIGAGSRIHGISGSGDWGPPRWLPHIFDVFMDGAADTVSYQLRRLLGKDFVRCEIPLAGADTRFDDASARNIADLQLLGDRYAEKYAQAIADAIMGK